MVLLGLLPGLTYAVVLGVLHRTQRGGDDLSTRALFAAVLCTTWMLVGTEGLSAAHVLSTGPVLGWWLLGLGLATLAWRHSQEVPVSDLDPSAPLDWSEKLMVGMLGFFLLSALIAALLSPPNNYDTLTYHMARQVYWIQHASLDHYPSNSLRQLFMPPLAEFWGVNLYILAADDRFANMVQWGAYALGILAISHLAHSLGASRRGRLFAACIGASNPMAWLNASSPKNDLLVALWVLCVAVFGLNVVRRRICTWADAVLIGWTVGLLALTKGTAAVFALPVCLIVGGVILWTDRWRAIALGLVIVVFSVIPNLGHFHRNYSMFGNPSGPVEPENEGTSLYTNQSHSFGDLATNVIRNVTLHLGLPSDSWNAYLQQESYALHKALDLDPNKDSITWKRMPYKVVYLPGSENNAGALFHFLLSLIVPFWAWRAVRDEPDRQRKWVVRAWTVVPLIGFVLFCAVFRWQPWHARLHIPIFGLMSPLAGLCFAKSRSGKWFGIAFILAAFAWFIPSMPNVTRPLWGKHNIFTTPRVDQRFSVRRQWIAGSKLMVEVAKAIDAKQIGFHMGHNEYQHPLMQMLREELGDEVSFVNVNSKAVSNPEGTQYMPDMVIRTRSKWHELMVGGIPYVSSARRNIFTAYVAPEKVQAAPDEHGAALFYGWLSMSGMKKPGHGVRLMTRKTATLRYRHFRKSAFTAVLVVTNPYDKPVKVRIRNRKNTLSTFTVPPKETIHRNVKIPARAGTDVLYITGRKGLKFTTLRTSPWRPDLYEDASTLN